MGKQKLKGKERRDKYYHLAKETGFRARSSFKLLQLNKKYNFLQNSKVLVDLCAAPGGWLQVAAEHMPMQSLIIGVDLAPIKPIRGVQTFQDDITTDSCRNKIKSELHGWKVDCFLNDGAPNVGKNWLHDAYSQSVLTLHALKLACTFLRKGGWFITKVFRSKDYQALLWVFNEMFGKVYSTKPQASRNVSAEIFVVCQNFKYDNINKIDKKFFDPRSVFEEVEENRKPVSIMDFEFKKAKATGYKGEFKPLMFTQSTVEEFINCESVLTFLKDTNKIVVTDEERKQLKISDNLYECLQDLKCCGKRDIKAIMKWHTKVRKSLDGKIEEEAKEEEEDEKEELDSDDEMQLQAQELLEEESKAIRKKNKKMLKTKAKNRQRLKNIKMTDVITHDGELFDIQSIKTKAGLGAVDAGTMDVVHSDSDAEDESSDEDQSSDDEEEDEMEIEENPLVVKEEAFGLKENFFGNEKFQDIEDEEDDLAQAQKYYSHKKKMISAKQSEVKSEKVESKPAPVNYACYTSDSDSDDDVQSVQTPNMKFTAESLALGTVIATSKRSKEAIIDDSFCRYTFNDESLPDWFVEDEKKRIVRTNLDKHTPKDLVDFYKSKETKINDRTIKKVVEAKFRKRYHRMKKVEKVNKQAESITDSTDMSNREKAVQLKSLYKKSGLSKNKREHTTYVYARKGMGQKVRRPAGVTGRFKVVDKRMKKELRATKRAAKKNK